jgi:hypothetical protein
MALRTFQVDRTGIALETISPERNEQHQSPTKMPENQRPWSVILPLITDRSPIRALPGSTNESMGYSLPSICPPTTVDDADVNFTLHPRSLSVY